MELDIGPSSLDYIKHNRNSCGAWTMQEKVTEKGKTSSRYVRLGCKKWVCPKCGAKKVKRLRHAIIKTAVEKNMRRFLTLTLDPKSCSPEESIYYIKKSWDKFRVYLKRKFGVSVSYIAITELQKSGYAHLHILVDRYIQQSWISANWQAVGGGKIVFITLVDIQRIAGYLSKYLTKELLLGGYKPNQRRYTTSRDIVLFVKKTTGKWKLIKKPIETLFKSRSSRISETSCDETGVLQMFEMELLQPTNSFIWKEPPIESGQLMLL